MTEIEAAQIVKRIRDEIARLEADIADGGFLTAEDLARANGPLSGLRTALWLSEMMPENDDFPENMREIIERLLKEMPRMDKPTEPMVW